jgi:polysaccharide biosynthesis/export protein
MKIASNLLMLAIALYPTASLAQLPNLVETGQLQPKYNPTIQHSPPIQGEYILGPGDILRVDIFDAPQYSGESQVRVDGVIDLPLGGSVWVDGMTLPQATAAIESVYNQLFKYPLVSVRLTGPRPLQVAIAGEINHPGAYLMEIPLQAQGGLQRGFPYPTVTDLITKAGGVNLAADISRVEVRRGGRIATIDLWEFLQTGLQLNLQDGDAIFIPTAVNPSEAQIRQLASTNFAIAPETPRTVTIVGAVNRPGSYVLTGGSAASELKPAGQPTVTWAIEQAGGITELANVRQVEVHRQTSCNTVGRPCGETVTANLWEFLQTGSFQHDPILQDGDTIVVPTGTEINPAEVMQLASASFAASITVYVAGEVNKSGSILNVEVPANTTLNQALMAAGGFTARAERDEVDLVRINPDGTASSRTIELDLTQGINEQTNPVLRNNDIIVVNRSGLVAIIDTLETILDPAPEANSLVKIFETLGIITQGEESSSSSSSSSSTQK